MAKKNLIANVVERDGVAYLTIAGFLVVEERDRELGDRSRVKRTAEELEILAKDIELEIWDRVVRATGKIFKSL